jgi:glycerol kinase
VWDKFTGKPLHNAIVWLDLRTAELADELTKAGGQDRFRDICGLPISTYFSAMKFLWLQRHVPEVAQAIAEGRALFGTIDTWLIWNLSGGVDGGTHVTDVTNAGRTMLMDLTTCSWHAPDLT